jgi:3-oxoacyl-[acyl-carrier-protein] synthase II
MRIAITGIGLVSPVGLDTASCWQALLEGRSGIDEIASFDTDGFPIRVAGEVRGFDPAGLVNARDARRLDRNVLLALAAAREAADDAGLVVEDPRRVGVLVGSAIGGFNYILEQHRVMLERGWERVSPHFLPGTLVDTASGCIATMLGVRGPNYAPVSACATGAHAIGEAAELLRRGDADVVLAGGVEACLNPLLLAGFTTMRGLASPRPGEPAATAGRPFDATRDGFVCAEGASIVVLEPVRRALARGARVHAEVLGHGISNDAYHVVTPRPDSLGVIEMMRAALERCGVAPHEVGYINVHGTGTPQGDVAETQALKEVFGEHARSLAISSTKSATGHQFGAAGAFETAVAALAVRDGVVPPTINYRDPDPDCDLDYVTEGARRVDARVALSNSMGLGGHNACVLVTRHDADDASA